MTMMQKDPSRKQTSDTHQTHYEMFASAEGVLRITEHYELQSPSVKYGRCNSSLICSKNTQSGDLHIALRLEYKDSDGYEYVSILDDDEIPALEMAIRYIVKNYDRIIRQAKTYTEVTYRTRSGFYAGMYVTPKREVGEYMSVGGQSVFFHTLRHLGDLVDEALFRIQSIRSAASDSTTQ